MVWGEKFRWATRARRSERHRLVRRESHQEGIIGPKLFLDLFGHLKVAELLNQGNFGPEFEMNVREEKIDLLSKYEIRTEIPEGVICKAGTGHDLTLWKVKTSRYKEELKRRQPID
jgi:hypothetical protein